MGRGRKEGEHQDVNRGVGLGIIRLVFSLGSKISGHQ